MELERVNILSFLDWCLNSGHELRMTELLGKFSHFLFAKGYWTDLVYYLNTGISICNQNDLIELEAKFTGGSGLGRIYFMQALYGESEKFLRRAISLYQFAGNNDRVDHSASYLGLVLLEQDKYTDAKQILNPRLEAARARHSLTAISRLQIVLAQIDLMEGIYQDARVRLEEARNIRDRKDAEGTALAVIYRLLGHVELKSGNLQVALTHFETSLVTAEKIRVVTDIARAKAGLAETYLRLGQREKSVKYKNEAIELLRELGMEREATKVEQIVRVNDQAK